MRRGRPHAAPSRRCVRGGVVPAPSEHRTAAVAVLVMGQLFLPSRRLAGGRVTVASVSEPTASHVAPVERYVARLDRKRMAAGILFRDADGRVLLVQPSYKPNWEIPGGAVEADESPWTAASRELREELGIDRAVGRLLVVDYVRPQDSRPEGVIFIFDGGILDERDLAGLVVADAEILSVGLHTLA